MAFSLQNRISEQQTVKNNDKIVVFQAEHIGKIERQFANGEIDRETYKAEYARISEIIRQMGR